MASLLELRPVLNTERLTLTLFKGDDPADCDQLFPVLTHLARSLSQDGPPLDAHEFAQARIAYFQTSGRISASLLGGRTPTRCALYLVRLGADAPSGEAIGVAALLQRSYLPDQGWAVLGAHGGKGYATESGRELLRYARDELGLRHIMATTHRGNAGSQAVARKLGYVQREVGVLDFSGTPLNLLTLPGAPLPPEELRVVWEVKKEGDDIGGVSG